jgi:CHASE2 domain-containing sensor protein
MADGRWSALKQQLLGRWSTSSLRQLLSRLSSQLTALVKRLAAHLIALVREDPWHWVVAAALIAAGSLYSATLESFPPLFNFRYRIYYFLLNLSPREPFPTDTTIVALDDDLFWHGELARRSPVKRRYLAKLVREIAKFHPKVIALDIKLSATQTQSWTNDHRLQLPVEQDYVDETAELLEAIRDVAATTDVVLAKRIAYADPEETTYKREANLYDTFDFKSKRVRSAYINLHRDDERYVPPILPMTNGPPLRSFALEIVNSATPEILERKDWSQLMFASFIPITKTNEKTVSASEVCDPNHDTEKLERGLGHRRVLVGATWHTKENGQGGVVDPHPSPLGEIAGVVLHANYVEAILDQRVYPLKHVEWWVEAMAGLLLAYLFALHLRQGSGIVLLGVIVAVSLFLSYFLLQNFGIFCDVVILNVLLVGHVLLEPVVLSWIDGYRTRHQPH